MNTIEKDIPALIGVSFSNQVIYNIVEQEGDFDCTGLSTIEYLNHDKNKFVADIVLSQSYECIDLLLDDHMVFGEYYDAHNTNIDSFNNIYNMMFESSVGYYYIYDMVEDVLFIKTPDLKKPLAVDYKNRDDVQHFKTILQWK